MKIVCAILSYKMADLTDRTVRQLVDRGFTLGEDLFVFENQTSQKGLIGLSEKDRDLVSKNVTHYTGSNLRMTGGFNYICDTVASWPQEEQPSILWLCTNDFEILRVDQAKTLKETIESAFRYPGPRGSEAFTDWWHPSLEAIPGYAYPWMFHQPSDLPRRPHWTRRVWMTDFICPAIRWNKLVQIKAAFGDWFDPAFYRGWGIDYETCYRIRQDRCVCVVDDRVLVRHEASKTYTSGAAPESKNEFYSEALKEMHKVMLTKYGPGWLQKMQEAR